MQRRKFLLLIFLIAALTAGWFIKIYLIKLGFEYPREQNTTLADENNVKITDGVKHSIPLEDILDGGPGKDGIPSIDQPKFIGVNEAKSVFKEDGQGLVVSIGSDSRFYPYQILVWHELVNDTVGGTPVLVSYCPLCNSGIVFERKINSEVAGFGVSGKLYNSDLLMYDRKTDSLWSQISGEAVVGPLTGAGLTQLEANVITLQVFSKKFPQGKVLSKDTGFTRDYERNPYGNYSQTKETLFPVNQEDSRLNPKTVVYGIEVGGNFKAYPEEVLKAKGLIKDALNSHAIELSYNEGLIEINDITAGMNILVKPSFWFAWFAFHPSTEVYREGI